MKWAEWIKKYYNSTVIRAGIYLLSAIMKNFVLNYERQLVDSCDNNGRAEPIQINFINLRMERVSPQQLNQAKQTKQFNNQFNFIEWFLNAGCLFCGCCCPAAPFISFWRNELGGLVLFMKSIIDGMKKRAGNNLSLTNQSNSASFKLKKFNLICWIVNWFGDCERYYNSK